MCPSISPCKRLRRSIYFLTIAKPCAVYKLKTCEAEPAFIAFIATLCPPELRPASPAFTHSRIRAFLRTSPTTLELSNFRTLELLRPHHPHPAKPIEQRGLQTPYPIRARPSETNTGRIFEIDGRARNLSDGRACPENLCQHLRIKGKVVCVLFQGQFLTELASRRKNP